MTIALLILAPEIARAAARLEGRVVDAADGKPLAYTALELRGPSGSRALLAGSTGRFVVDGLAPGSYSIDATFLGYAPKSLSFDLIDGASTSLLIELEVEAIELEQIDVEGRRNRVEEEVQTGIIELEGDDLLRIPAFGEADPIRALQLLPGVQAASDISSGLYVRGGGPDQTLVLLDGSPIYNPTHAFGLFSSFHPDLIDDVTLYKGAYPARYGGRLGAVLDIRSRDGRTKDMHGKVGASTIAARALFEGTWGDRSWTLGARRTYLDPLLSILRRSNDQIPEYWFGDLNAKLTLPSDDGSTELRAYVSRDALGIVGDETTNIDLVWGNQNLSATHRRLFGETAVLTGSVWASRYRSDTQVRFLNTPARFENRLLDTTGEVTLGWQLPPHHRFTVGLAASRYDFQFAQSFNLDQQVDFEAEAWDLAAIFEDVWRPRTETTLRLGMRTRWLSDGDRVRVEPRVSWRQQLDDRWTFKLGGGVYHQILQLVGTEGFSGTDFYLPIDETAPPSRSWQLVSGVEVDLSRTWQLTVEGYGTRLDDVVLLDNEIPADQSSATAEDIFITGGEGWSTGAEFFLQKRRGRLTGWLGYTLGWTRRRFDELNGGEEFPPKYDRRHDLSAVLRYTRGPWEFGTNFVYGTGQAFTPAAARYSVRNPATGEPPIYGDLLAADRNSARLLPYHRLDLNVRRSFTLVRYPAAWTFQVFNVYSRRNDWFVTFDAEDPNAAPEIVKQLPLIPSLGVEVEF